MIVFSQLLRHLLQLLKALLGFVMRLAFFVELLLQMKQGVGGLTGFVFKLTGVVGHIAHIGCRCNSWIQKRIRARQDFFQSVMRKLRQMFALVQNLVCAKKLIDLIPCL